MGIKEWKDRLFPQIDAIDDDGMDIDDAETEESISDRTPVAERIPEQKPVYAGRVSDNGGYSVSNRSSIEMKVVSPTKFENVTQIADLLLDKKTVLLNLENTNRETAKRLIDFLSGVAYALSGDIQKVADNTFAVTPNNVAVSNEIIESEPFASEDGEQYE